MKLVLFENPRPPSPDHVNDVANAPLSASLNSGYALAIARRAGWDTAYLDFSASGTDSGEIAERILNEEPDLVLLHWVYAWGHERAVVAILERLKREGVPCLAAFGLFPTLAHRRLAEFAPQLDLILVGEFEQTLQELLEGDAPALPPLPGLYRAGQRLVPRPLLSDLSWLPAPDDVGGNLAHGTLNLAASRGCFGDCSFCFITTYYGCHGRRTRSIASLSHELERRLARRRVAEAYFVDPTFLAPGDGQQRQRAAAIGGLMRSSRLPFGFETRVDSVDDPVVAQLAADGATSIFLGIESGCHSALQRMNKRITPDQIERAVECVRHHGLRLSAGFIMFEPDGTLEELLHNYRFLERLGLLEDHDQTVNMLYHSQIVLFGSRAWARFEQAGRLVADPCRPFEAHYLFRDERVARVCSGMRRLATAYFDGIGACRRRTGSGAVPASAEINQLLKEGFLALVEGALCGTTDPGRVAERFVCGLQQCLSPMPADFAEPVMQDSPCHSR